MSESQRDQLAIENNTILKALCAHLGMQIPEAQNFYTLRNGATYRVICGELVEVKEGVNPKYDTQPEARK